MLKRNDTKVVNLERINICVHDHSKKMYQIGILYHGLIMCEVLIVVLACPALKMITLIISNQP